MAARERRQLRHVPRRGDRVKQASCGASRFVMTWRCELRWGRLGWVRWSWVVHGTARFGMAGGSRLVMSWQGTVRCGVLRCGRQGQALWSLFRLVWAWLCVAVGVCLGQDWLVGVRQGRLRQARCVVVRYVMLSWC